MKERSTRLLAALALLVVGLACHDVSDPTDPGIRGVTPVLRPLQALPEASVSLPAVSDAQVPLPTYTDPILAEVTISGLTSMTSHDSSYYVHYAGPVDGAGIHNSSGNAQCSMSAQISYPMPGRVGLGGSGAGVCTNPPQQRPTWTGTMILQGAGVALRGPGVLEPTYQCGASECHTYSGEQTVVVRPLAVAINTLTPGSQSAGAKTIMVPQPGIWTLFRASSTPDTINGYEVPVKAISWNWIPDSAPARSTVPCTNALKLCSAYIIEPGRMELTAQVNGVEQVDVVTVIDAEVKITPEKASMRPSIRFVNLKSVYVYDSSKQKLTISVTGPSGPIPNKTVTLDATANDGTAGHINHPANTKPRGGFFGGGPTVDINTGPTGVVDTVVFVAPDPSGPVTITGTSSGAKTAKKDIQVEVLGLMQLPTDTKYDLTGELPEHPDSHYVNANHLGFIVALANEFWSHYQGAKKLTFNDASLVSGGLFEADEGLFWNYPHRTHRLGRDTDLKTIDRTRKELDTVRDIWQSKYAGGIFVEGDHWHLTK